MADKDGVDLQRINEIEKKKKEKGLTEKEDKEQSKLRKAYWDSCREKFKQQIESTRVIDPEGNDVTPDKVKNILDSKNKEDKN